MNENQDPAINKLFHLEELAKNEMGAFMDGFLQEDPGKGGRFFDPILQGTLQNKPSSQIQGALMLYYWDKAQNNQLYEKAVECVIEAFTSPERRKTSDKDWTLANLLHELSPWHHALGENGNWFAMNWAWGLLKSGLKNVNSDQLRLTMAIWGRVILSLRQAGAPLQWVVIGLGDWGMWDAQKPLSGENEGVLPAAYYPRWFIGRRPHPRKASTVVPPNLIDGKLTNVARHSYEVCLELSQDPHEVRFMPHPGMWGYLDAFRCVPPQRSNAI